MTNKKKQTSDKLTTPVIISSTANSLDNVNLSAREDGKIAASIKVKSPDADEIMLTIPAFVSLRAS